jgi:hypothetical protein
LIAAPGTPKAQLIPSLSSTSTAASTARILAMANPPMETFSIYKIYSLKMEMHTIIWK